MERNALLQTNYSLSSVAREGRNIGPFKINKPITISYHNGSERGKICNLVNYLPMDFIELCTTSQHKKKMGTVLSFPKRKRHLVFLRSLSDIEKGR